jgi:hypothetical protein
LSMDSLATRRSSYPSGYEREGCQLPGLLE